MSRLESQLVHEENELTMCHSGGKIRARSGGGGKPLHKILKLDLCQTINQRLEEAGTKIIVRGGRNRSQTV